MMIATKCLYGLISVLESVSASKIFSSVLGIDSLEKVVSVNF